jgi:uncharacterized membrane protein
MRGLVLLIVAGWAQLALHAPLLPARVACHFGAGGAANGWMTKPALLVFQAVELTLLPLFMLALAHFLPRLPPRWLSLPRRDYWLDAGRREATYAYLQHFTLGMAILMQLFMLALAQAVLVANTSRPVRLPALFGFVLAGFLAFTAAMIAAMYWRFRAR